jgi:hypothetical protein
MDRLDSHIMGTFQEYWDAERQSYNDDADEAECSNCGSTDIDLVNVRVDGDEVFECQECGEFFSH